MANGISIDEAKCTGCMICTQICTLHNFEKGDDGKVHSTDEGMACFNCGHCVAVCPTDAISHSALDFSQFEPMDESSRLPYDRLMAFLNLRRSRREFKSDPVPKEEIEKLIKAAVVAPSSINAQSVLYTVITDPDRIRKISDRTAVNIKRMGSMMKNPLTKAVMRLTAPKTLEDLENFVPLIDSLVEMQAQGMDMVLYDAPCVIVLHAPKTDFCAPMDAIFNAENILLAVETLGLGACVIGFVTEPANRDSGLKELLGIPKDHKVFSTIAVGYPKFKYRRTVPKKAPVINFI